jgi:hypothetical protein
MTQAHSLPSSPPSEARAEAKLQFSPPLIPLVATVDAFQPTAAASRTRRHKRSGRGEKGGRAAAVVGRLEEVWRTVVARGSGGPTAVGVGVPTPLVLVLALSAPVVEAPFVVGARGRNAALVRKHTGYFIHIVEGRVMARPQPQPPHDLDLAQRMVLSASAGGILRWFVAPEETARGYPPERQEALLHLAADHGCDLRLLRSHCGHLCLMLVPQDGFTTPDEAEAVRLRVREARQALLMMLVVHPVHPPSSP